MSVIIVNTDSTKFTVDGITNFKNFYPQVAGNKIRIVSAYDSTFELVPYTDFDQYTVDGNNTWADVNALQQALLPVLYSRSGLGGVDINGNITNVTLAGYILTFTLADTSEINIDLSQIQTNDNDIDAHVNNQSNPHNVTKLQLGLGNVDNTSDLNKPLSTAAQTALNNKVDKGGVPLDVNTAGLAIGQKVFGYKAGINNGYYFEGYVQGATPPTNDSHINFTYRLYS